MGLSSYWEMENPNFSDLIFVAIPMGLSSYWEDGYGAISAMACRNPHGALLLLGEW